MQLDIQLSFYAGLNMSSKSAAADTSYNPTFSSISDASTVRDANDGTKFSSDGKTKHDSKPSDYFK